MEYFGVRQWMKAIRIRKGYSQDYVALRSGISQPMYSKIERGYTDPSDAVIANIAGVLDFPVDRFAHEEAARRKVV